MNKFHYLSKTNKLLIKYSITTFLSTLLLILFSVTQTKAQSCSQTHCPVAPLTCNSICSGSSYSWDCLPDYNECCSCLCGWAPDYSSSGPIYCSASGRYNVAGSLPCPTSPPRETNTPAPTNTPVPPSYWFCLRPFAQSNKCEYTGDIQCAHPDIPEGICFTNQNNCEANCVPLAGTTITPLASINPLCTYAPGQYGIDSAIGCIPIDNNNETTKFVLRWALGVGSGITFLLIVYSAFLIMGSGGNTEKVKSGKTLLTAALTGLILIIFSVFILDIFGLRIFKLQGLQRP